MRQYIILKTGTDTFHAWSNKDVLWGKDGVTVEFESGRVAFIPYAQLIYLTALPENHPEAGRPPR